MSMEDGRSSGETDEKREERSKTLPPLGFPSCSAVAVVVFSVCHRHLSPNHRASQVVLRPKKDGGHRFCVDFRKVHAVTETDGYLLPNNNVILESLSDTSLFSTIDLNSGYWQVAMDSASRQKKSAFVTHTAL